jgi:hypothetical protein
VAQLMHCHHQGQDQDEGGEMPEEIDGKGEHGQAAPRERASRLIGMALTNG